MDTYPDSTDWHFVAEAELAELDPAVKAWAARSAWATLSRLSAGQIAMVPVTVRPCEEGGVMPLARGGYLGPGFSPYLSGGKWRNSVNGSYACGLSEVVLDGPVGGIVEVRVDGVVLGPDLYRLDDGNRLVSLGVPWPRTQELGRQLGEEGTFAITYWRGAAPNPMTNMAAGVLAAEYVKAYKGSKGCRLPSRVRSVSRQGVDFEISTDMFADGITDIPEVDRVIGLYNPGRLRAAPAIMSPDSRPHRRVATPPLAPAMTLGSISGFTTPAMTSPEVTGA